MTVKVKAEWTESTDELLDLLESKKVNDNSRRGILLTLEKDTHYKAMIKWIKQNPKAKQSDIIKQVKVIRADILGKCKPVSYDLSLSHSPLHVAHTTKKIASAAMF